MAQPLKSLATIGAIALAMHLVGFPGTGEANIADKLEPGNRVVMYSLTTCGYCVEKRKRLTSAGILFDEVFVDRDPARMNEFNALLAANSIPNGAVGTPTFTVNGKLLVNNPDMAIIKQHLKFKNS